MALWLRQLGDTPAELSTRHRGVGRPVVTLSDKTRALRTQAKDTQGLGDTVHMPLIRAAAAPYDPCAGLHEVRAIGTEVFRLRTRGCLGCLRTRWQRLARLGFC